MGCQASSVLAKEAPLPQYNNETALSLLNHKERKAAVNAVDGAIVPTLNEAADIDTDFDISTLQRRPPHWLVMVDRSHKDLGALSTSTQSASSDPTSTDSKLAGYSVERASVKSVLNGNTFVLYDGRVVRLAGVAVPQKGEPYYKKAKRLLEHFTLGQWLYLEKEDDGAIPDYEFAAPVAETFRQSVTRKFKSRRSARRLAKRTKATQQMLQREESQRQATLEYQKKRHGESASEHPSEPATVSKRRPPPREAEDEEHVSEPSSPLKRHRAEATFGPDVNEKVQTLSNEPASPSSPSKAVRPSKSKHSRKHSAPAESSSQAVPLPTVVYLRTVYTVVNGEKGYMNLNAAVVAYGYGTVLLEDGNNGQEVPEWMKVAIANKEKEYKETKKAEYLRAMQQGEINLLPRRKQSKEFHVPEFRSPLDPTQDTTQQVLLASPTHSPNGIDPSRPPYTYPSNRALLLDCIRNAIVFPVGRWVAEEQLLAKVYVPINESTDRKYLHHKGCASLSEAAETKCTTLRRALVMGRSCCPNCRHSINEDCRILSERRVQKERAAEAKERDRRARFKQRLLDEYEEKKREMQTERQKEAERRNMTPTTAPVNGNEPVSHPVS